MEGAQNDPPPVEAEDKAAGFQMRDYTPKDRNEIVALFDQMFSNPNGLKSIALYFNYPMSRQVFRDYIDSQTSSHRTVVLSPEGSIVGWGTYSVDSHHPQRAVLTRIIKPEFQGRGLGVDLIGRLIERCRDLNPKVATIESETSPQNTAAIKSLDKAVGKFAGYKVDEPGMKHVHFIFPLNRPHQPL